MDEFQVEISEKAAHVDESVKSAHKRIDDLKRLTELVYDIASSMKTMQNSIKTMDDRLKVIEDKPAKRWELIVTSVITTLVGIAIGYFVK